MTALSVRASSVWTTLVLACALVGGSAVPVLAQGEAPAEAAAEAVAEAAAEAVAEAAVQSAEDVRPSLPRDLPRRKTSGVPRFVGPATLKLKGGPGRYAWQQLRFGAEEAQARVRLTPDGRSCALRLRIVEDGKPVVREWFSADRESEVTRVSVLGVDYSVGSLRVASDCASWSVRLSPLEDPDLDVVIGETYYTVRGDSIHDLSTQTQHVRDKWAAWTEWYTTWSYWAEDSAATGEGEVWCDVSNGETQVEVSIVYPRWEPPQGTDPAVVREWERFLKHLRIHEQGHVTIALQGADAIDDRLDAGFTGPTCEEAGARADERAQAIFEHYSRASERYDKETAHGLAQGTGLGQGL